MRAEVWRLRLRLLKQSTTVHGSRGWRAIGMVRLMRFETSIVGWLSGLGLAFVLTQPACGDDHLGSETFDRVSRLLQQYCSDCHSRDSSDGRWAFDSYQRYEDLIADQAAWRKVKLALSHHTMPPIGEPAPTREQRMSIVDWIEDSVFYVDPNRPDPGPA